MAANDGPLRVIRETTEEAFGKVPKRLNFLNDAFTEGECFYTTEADISLDFRSEHLEGDLVLALEEKHFEVLNFSVCKKDCVVAHKMLGFVRGDQHIKSSV